MQHKKRWIAAAVVLAALVGIGIGLAVYFDKVYKVCTVEAGVSVEARDFLKREADSAEFAEDSGSFDTAVPGSYPVRIRVGAFTYNATLVVQDTIAPAGEAVPQETMLHAAVEAESFVTNILDATAVTVDYKQSPDFSQPGEQAVTVVLTDAGENRTEIETTLYVSRLRSELIVEAGSDYPEADDFLMEGTGAELLTDFSTIDMTKLGTHTVALRTDGREAHSVLTIVDTVPPQGEVQDVESYERVEKTLEDFVVADSIYDATEVTVSFEKEPDFSAVGTQEVCIVFTDEAGNETKKNAELTIFADNEPPVITGTRDLTVTVGGSVSYKQNVKVTDNSGAEVSLQVDTSAVDLNAAGTYNVLYQATDAAGNTASQQIVLTVVPVSYDREQIEAKANEVLAGILTDDMSQEDKALAIYRWIQRNIAYVDHAEKESDLQGAYVGLFEKKGDCFVFAKTAKLLLTQAGIPNMDIEKIPAKTRHCWNLVDVGNGWVHFDATPRRNHPFIFCWTDEQLMEYSNANNLSHNYDRTVYTMFGDPAEAEGTE